LETVPYSSWIRAGSCAATRTPSRNSRTIWGPVPSNTFAGCLPKSVKQQVGSKIDIRALLLRLAHAYRDGQTIGAQFKRMHRHVPPVDSKSTNVHIISRVGSQGPNVRLLSRRRLWIVRLMRDVRREVPNLDNVEVVKEKFRRAHEIKPLAGSPPVARDRRG